MRKFAKFLALFLVFPLLTGCGKKDTESAGSHTLVVGTLQFDGKFSPFFSTNAYENDVLSLISLPLLGTDREGAVILQGIAGETRAYNGTQYTYTGIADCAITQTPTGSVYYDFTLRPDVVFSDGKPVTIDDVIFSFYVAVDPAYDGTMTVYSLPIAGMEDYRSGNADHVTGLTRTGDYTMRVALTEVSASAIDTLAGIPVAPLHYYGDTNAYDYSNNRFGFPKGDLSRVKSVTSTPLGAGPYVFHSYSGGTLTLESNDRYWKGQPKIRYIQYREGQDADKLPGVVAGTLDIAEPSYSTETAKAIQNANDGAITGDVLTTRLVSNLGYGYIGFNAKNVCVNGDPGSEASRNLRKAIATVIAVYRDVAVDSYYGEYAEVINYPISNTSWAAPRVTDSDYRVAFSTAVDGSPIYTQGMTAQARYHAAKEAALGYFSAAGYQVENGKVTAPAPGGAMSYEVLVGAGGTGDHPTFMALTMASVALKELGFSLIVTDISNFSELTGAVHSGTAELFAMAWGASPDPDMYQIYHSQGSSNETSYHLKDAQLDEMILLARQSMDRSYRKTLYKACLDLIADWAVEIPMYQRQNAVIFSTQRIRIDTLTPDITTFWGWENDIEKLELK